MKQHIAITGIPRSGSTLLYCLLRHTMQHAGWKFYDKEERAFVKMLEDIQHRTVTKKPSDVDSFRVVNSAARDHGIALRWVVTIRDPRDILCSKLPLRAERALPGAEKVFAIDWDRHAEGGVGLKYRMESILRLVQSDCGIPVTVIKYETLVRKPDMIQEMMFPESHQGRMFSDYSSTGLVDESHYHSVRMHGPRPVDSTSIGQWQNHRARVEGQLAACPDIRRYAEKLGYRF